MVEGRLYIVTNNSRQYEAIDDNPRLRTRFNGPAQLQAIPATGDIFNVMDRGLHSSVQALVRTTNSIEDAAGIIDEANRIAKASGKVIARRALASAADRAEALQKELTRDAYLRRLDISTTAPNSPMSTSCDGNQNQPCSSGRAGYGRNSAHTR